MDSCLLLSRSVDIDFSEWFLLKRKRAELSQTQLANELGVKPQSIGNWENGRSIPTLNPCQVKKLCEMLNVTLEELCNAVHWEGPSQ
ncbi:helix-turn-helix transcriptional regulator [Acaryochloris marina]|uniref:HTH cro/C1-type domain-containing protein n=1 Tax=Acaryochloris marina (strain MBIC 11017) TaxID=329726 RepID=A8ZP63_ACAM1|nr:helix-turn-helix transcriptional regulator [Acaryochloris marina]ABW32799.1 conserved hypothetical protein [Acaryochloris marina MBIC11017]